MPGVEKYDLGDFKLQNGETLPNAFIGEYLPACLRYVLVITIMQYFGA